MRNIKLREDEPGGVYRGRSCRFHGVAYLLAITIVSELQCLENYFGQIVVRSKSRAGWMSLDGFDDGVAFHPSLEVGKKSRNIGTVVLDYFAQPIDWGVLTHRSVLH